jgi:surface antigen
LLLSFAAVLAAASDGGCAYHLNSLVPNTGTDVEQTGSLSRINQQSDLVLAPEVDLAYARKVAVDALARNESREDSVPWQNPNTGAEGNITPLGSPSKTGTFTCRDFLASYFHGQTQVWLRGEACRIGRGKWAVLRLHPLKETSRPG